MSSGKFSIAMAYKRSAQFLTLNFSVCLAMLNANECSNGVERRCFCASDDIICQSFATQNNYNVVWQYNIPFQSIKWYIKATLMKIATQWLHTQDVMRCTFLN
jgi:hypothetical protein